MLVVTNRDSGIHGEAVVFQIRELLEGRILGEYTTEAPTSMRAVEMATGRPVTLHRCGNYFLEVTNLNTGRVSAYQYADLLY